MQRPGKEKGPSRTKSRFDTDVLFSRIGCLLVKDFRALTNKPEEFGDFLAAYQSGIENVHQYSPPSYMGADYTNFKCWYQLHSLVKRYTSPKDVITPSMREKLTVDKFLSVQTEVYTGRQRTHRAYLVLREARAFIKKVLGEFSEEKVLSYVAYGKRANTGVPYSQSYLDTKFGMISGSPEHVLWFEENYLPHDKIMQEAVALRNNARHEYIQSLALTCVPKKHNIDRTIMPNTVLGTFYTNALMVMVEDCLAQNGYYIPTLQKRHGMLAQYGSRTGKLATGDLTSASDLPGFSLACSLLPRKWLRAFKRGRLSMFTKDGTSYHLESFMAMGISYTFPLETLLFLALLKSIAKLASVTGTISVYGDDLIYPVALAPFVSGIFADLGLKFNKEKSFSTGHFRESCGQDFMYGKPVRPFQPEVQGGVVTPSAYRTLLFKTINGLNKRWQKTEIPSTLHYLHCELHRVGGGVYVPPSYPDSSGIHLDATTDILVGAGWTYHGYLSGLSGPWYHEYAPAVWDPVRQALAFQYYADRLEQRPVSKKLMLSYYWDTLRRASLKEEASIEMKYLDPADIVVLKWTTHKRETVRTTNHGLLPKMHAYVPLKSGRPTSVRQTGFTSAWI